MKKTIFVICSSTLFSYFFILFLQEPYSFIDSLLVPYLSIISGIIIASISTILGNINNLFTILALKKDELGQENIALQKRLESVEQHLQNVISQIKENSIFIVLVCLSVILIRLTINIDFPVISFPINNFFLSKVIILKTLVLDLTILSTIAMLDTLYCFFTINDHFRVIK